MQHVLFGKIVRLLRGTLAAGEKSLDAILRPFEQTAVISARRTESRLIARLAGLDRSRNDPFFIEPRAVRTFHHHRENRLRLERVLPRRQRLMRIAIQLAIHGAHHPKRVRVEAHPDVQAVLFDAIAGVGIAAARALAAETPAELIDGDVVMRREPIGGGHRAGAATEDCDSHSVPPKRGGGGGGGGVRGNCWSPPSSPPPHPPPPSPTPHHLAYNFS